jgi:hypothetical protein
MVEILGGTQKPTYDWWTGVKAQFLNYNPTPYVAPLLDAASSNSAEVYDDERRLFQAQVNPFDKPTELTDEQLAYTMGLANEYGLNLERMDDLRYQYSEIASLGLDPQRTDELVRQRAQDLAALPDKDRIALSSEITASIFDPASNLIYLASGGAAAAVRAGMLTRAATGFGIGAAAETGVMGLESAAMDENRMSLTRALIGGAIEGTVGVLAGKNPVKAKQAFPPSIQRNIVAGTGATYLDAKPFLADSGLGSILEWGTPRRAGMMTSDTQLSETVKRFGGIILEENGQVVGRETDIAVVYMKLDFEDSKILNHAKNMLIPVYKTLGMSYDKGNTVFTQYRRFKGKGVEPTADQLNITQRELDTLSGEFDSVVSQYWDEFYETKRVQQMDAQVGNADILTFKKGSEYTPRLWDQINIPIIYERLPADLREGMLGKLIAGAIRAEQGDNLELIAKKLAAREINLRGKEYLGQLTPEQLLAKHLDDVKLASARYYERFGRGFMRSVTARIAAGRDEQTQVIRLDDLEQSVIRSMNDRNLGGAVGLDILTEDVEQMVKDIFTKRMEGKEASEFGPLNRRVAMDDTFEMRLSDLDDALTPEDINAIDALLTEVLGEKRTSRPGFIRVSDLLNNDSFDLASRYSRGSNRKIGMAQRGIFEEPLDIVEAAKERFRKLDKSKMSKAAIKREKMRVNSAIYDILQNAGYSDARALQTMIDVPDWVSANSTSLDTQFGTWLGAAKNFATSVFLPGVVFAQIPEAVAVLAQMGIPTLKELNQITEVWDAMRRVGRGEVIDDEFQQDIMALLDFDPASARGFDNVDMEFRVARNTMDAKVYNFSSDFRNRMMKANLLRPTTTATRVLTYSRSINRLRNWAQGRPKPFSQHDLEVNYRLDTPQKQQLAKRLIDKYAAINAETDTVRSLGLNRWAQDGPEAAQLARDLEMAIMDRMYSAVQEANRGFAPAWMQGGMLKYFMQFQTYAFNSLEKQGVALLARYRAGDTETANIILMSSFLASLGMYFSRTYATTLGMSEQKRRERFKKALNPANVVMFSIGYMPSISAPLSVASYPISAVSSMVTGTPISRGAIPSAPTFSVMQTGLNAFGGAYRLATGNATESSTAQMLRVMLGGGSDLPYIKPLTNTLSAISAGKQPSFGLDVLTPKD